MKMKQIDVARELGISKSYLSMILAGKRTIPEHLEQAISELVHKNQLQNTPSKQLVGRSNRPRDAMGIHNDGSMSGSIRTCGNR